MGILNVTPDSFSDGGLYLSLERAIKYARAMIEEGADIIDIGGESTRPGSQPVGLQEELDRVIPVVQAVRSRLDVRISIDSGKYEVALEAVKQGATLLNDVSGGSDIRMARLARDQNLDVILMHMQGQPRTMQREPNYPRGVVSEVREFLLERSSAFREHGVPTVRIWVDPGIGFGKTLEHNLELLSNLKDISSIGGRLVIGASRKSFIAKILKDPDLPFEKRLGGTIAANLWAFHCGASVFRVHEVGECRRALEVWRGIAHDRE